MVHSLGMVSRKVAHAVVQQDARAGRDDARAKVQAERLGEADHVTSSVDDY